MPVDSSVSVVISAYCDARGLRSTVESVYQQLDEEANKDLLLELIIVDDGAEPAVKSAISDLKNQHADIVVITQQNSGLTKSLIAACTVAKHEFIARIDVGDRMLKTRLRKQIDYLQNQIDVVAVATWAKMVTVEGFFLYQIEQTNQQILKSLQPDAPSTMLPDDFCSPQHYTMLFRKSVYEAVGGYRAEFYFAQDVDLWLRMSEQGAIDVIEESLTDSVLSENSLSGANNQAQHDLSTLAWQSAELRRQDKKDDDILLKASLIRPKPSGIITHNHQAKSLYFIAKCLLDQSHFGAKSYFVKALFKKPLSLKSWFGLMQSLLLKARKQVQ